MKRRGRRLGILVALLAVLPLAHGAVLLSTRMSPPAVAVTGARPTDDGPVRRLGASYTRTRAGVREVYLAGTPERIGEAHARLLYDRMVANEKDLWETFGNLVPFAPARTLLMDLSRVQYRGVDRGFPEPRRREIAAEARAFDPDPFATHLATYHRMVFLHSLYDISLSFEHSPLIGCSAFGLGPGATVDGHALLGRAFDLEAGDVFDRDKAVFFVRPDGAIPFASVAWPGLVGVVTGMNREGVAVIVNGARAGEPVTSGEPVVFGLREVLERAHDTTEAVEVLRAQEVMVSHLVLVADARGRFAVVERAPHEHAFVREVWTDPDRVALTNHFEGPLASDPHNVAVREHTTSVPRFARLTEMLAKVSPREASVPMAVAMLRDHACAGGIACELGDRRAIDAIIATHGIVADTTDKILWVSAGPHLSGRFVRFDLRSIFAEGHDPSHDPEPETIGEDPILSDGRYEAGRLRAGGPRFGGDMPAGEMKVSRRAVLGVAFGGALVVRRALADTSLGRALAEVAHARASLKTLSGPFSQTRTIGLLAAKVRSTGTLTLVRPDRLRWELAPPDDVVYWMTPDGLSYRNRAGGGTVRAVNARIANALDDLRVVLGGDLAALGTRYDLTVAGADDGPITFDAVPKPGVPNAVQHLTFALAADRVTPVSSVITEGPHDRTEITFGALEKNIAIDPARMRPPR